jgi:hypothetical protein
MGLIYVTLRLARVSSLGEVARLHGFLDRMVESLDQVKVPEKGEVARLRGVPTLCLGLLD